MARHRLVPSRLVVVLLTLAAVAAWACPAGAWVKEDPPADADKEWPIHTSDASCYLATAANMLAGAGYGHGSGIQERAEGLYTQLVDHFTLWGGGFPEQAIEWWLDSVHNEWPTNLYTRVTTYGSHYIRAWTDPEMPRFLANELRACKYAGLGIHGITGHAITLWGDELGGPAPLAANPTEAWITDSDDGPGYDLREYDYTYDTTTDPAEPRWRLGDSLSSPMITYAVTLGTDPDGVLARSGLKIWNNSDLAADTLEFTAWQKESWVEINAYDAGVNVPSGPPTIVPSDWPQGDGRTHSIDVTVGGMNVGPWGWVTAEVEFILSDWNTIRWKDVTLSGSGEEPLMPFAAHGWWCDSTMKPPGPMPGGYLIAAMDILDELGKVIAEERMIHQFSALVDKNFHIFGLDNDEDGETLVVDNVRFGYADCYLTSDDLWSFDAWLSAFGPSQIGPGQTMQWELMWDLPDPDGWDPLPEPGSLLLLIALSIPLVSARKARMR